MKKDAITLHDILRAWQAGTIPSARAMALSGIDTIGELYAAARSSGVPLRKTLLAAEEAAAESAIAAIRAKTSAMAAASGRETGKQEA